MRQFRHILIASLCCWQTPFVLAAENIEFTAKTTLQAQAFQQAGSNSKQQDFYTSIKLEPQLFYGIDANNEIRAQGFYRYDGQSPSNTHGDIRELMYYHFADQWEFRAGIGKVFWGTTESRHLVDTVNQTDFIESLDDEQRLGQPILQNRFIKDWGTLDLFILPGFRQQDFGQADLRPAINTIQPAIYQSADKDSHIDLAARWSHYFGDLDIGLSYFTGTQRAPVLNAQLIGSEIKLQPVYVQTQQFAIDGQYIVADWLLKAEALWRFSHNYNTSQGFYSYNSKALVTGFEYTFYDINEKSHDLGLIGEFLYDEWSAITPFQRDWMTGLRWVWNDAASTEFLLGHIYDLDDQSQIWQLEASRRLNKSWTLEMTSRWVTNVDANNQLTQLLKGHNLLNLQVSFYF
ncbi:hypothetical protein [Thiomicrorhabdus sediminis]|uniref:Phosphate-selective porin O and P n=1 Tax=Thiomicrorhabdus sediminis TaxID=2580412 RepID=A0A4P9K2R0_9GAMM|nr:hypothetical protein [Thiomicrorhabdus sediminis]QCU89134.1 hypothetical protein FE785_00075 [Thiomicrorhabdus sediminis]